MRIASTYRLRDRYLIHPEKRTTEGLWLAQPDFVSLSLKALPAELGVAVLGSLAQSSGVLPHPTVWAGLAKPRLVAAGVTSEKSFMLGAHFVGVSLTDGIFLEPSHNGGPSGGQRGFSPLPISRMSLPVDSTPEEVGKALLAAFNACTPSRARSN